MSPFQMIPAQIDILNIVQDLRALGWTDYKVEIAAGLTQGYIAQCRGGNIRQPAYDKAARLYNFWVQQTQVSAPSTTNLPRLLMASSSYTATARST